jgi:GNAT superfamily N-acetyltransferase
VESEFDIRSYEPGDEIHILELFRQSFGRDLAQARWNWKYKDNPAGPGLIDLAWHGDVLVAHHAVTPVGLRVHGTQWTTGLGVGVMTHPHHRQRGLFHKLLRRTQARMAELGMPMVWVFPNPFSHRLAVRDLGLVDIHEVPTLRMPLHSGSSLSLPPAHIAELQDFDDRFDQLWQRVRDDYPIIARRDREHLQWRYVRNPSQRYRILAYVNGDDLMGYAVCKRHQEEMQVIDILTVQDVEVGTQLILRAAQIAREGSASALSLWLNVSHPLHRMLEKLGFCNGEPVTYFAGRVLRPELREAEVYDYRKWYLTMGDSDVF